MFEVTMILIALVIAGLLALNCWINAKQYIEGGKEKKEEPKKEIVPAICAYDPSKDVTTICPAPLGSVTCSHKWDKISEQVLDVGHQQKYIMVAQCVSCGLIDKTIQITDKAPIMPAPPVPRSECRHKWVKEKSVTLDSPYEQLTKGAKSGYRLTNGKKDLEFDVNDAPPWMFHKTYVCVRICQSCGEIDKVVASNFEGEEVESAEQEEDDDD